MKRLPFITLKQKRARDRYVIASKRDPALIEMLIHEWADATGKDMTAEERNHMVEATLRRKGRMPPSEL